MMPVANTPSSPTAVPTPNLPPSDKPIIAPHTPMIPSPQVPPEPRNHQNKPPEPSTSPPESPLPASPDPMATCHSGQIHQLPSHWGYDGSQGAGYEANYSFSAFIGRSHTACVFQAFSTIDDES